MRSFTSIALSERTVEARLALWISGTAVGEHLIPISSLCVETVALPRTCPPCSISTLLSLSLRGDIIILEGVVLTNVGVVRGVFGETFPLQNAPPVKMPHLRYRSDHKISNLIF